MIRIEFEDIANEVLEVGKLYAIAKAKYEMLNDSKYSVLASEASLVEGSEAQRERIARTSDKFRKYLKVVQIARQDELELKYKLDSLQMSFEYCRSLNSLKKKEINNL